MYIVAETINTPNQIEVCGPLKFLHAYSGRGCMFTKSTNFKSVYYCNISHAPFINGTFKYFTKV